MYFASAADSTRLDAMHTLDATGAAYKKRTARSLLTAVVSKLLAGELLAPLIALVLS